MFVVLVAFIDIDPHDAYSWVYTEILQSSPYIVFFFLVLLVFFYKMFLVSMVFTSHDHIH